MEKKNNKYKYYSGHHSNINKLHQVVTNYRHATVLDAFVFFSMTTNFTMPNETELDGWFCLTYEDIAARTGYKEGTIKGIVKKFSELGFIEKVKKIVRNNCRACIRVTQKTLNILGLEKSCEQVAEKPPVTESSYAQESDKRKNLPTECTFESTKNAPAYNEYREKEIDINIITRVPRSEKQIKPYNLPESVSKIFAKVGERLQENQKSIIWGAICNLQKQHSKSISNLSEFVAWISFSIINAKYQLKNTFNFQHQLNCLMKIARTKEGLQKPRGFNNHWDIGKELKAQEEQRLSVHEARKQKGEGACSNNAIEISGSDNSSTGGYVVAKKVKELWADDGEAIKLKSERANLVTEINSIIADNKTIGMLFASKPELKLKEEAKNNKLIEKAKHALALIDEKLKVFKTQKESAKEMEWKPLYA